MQQASGYQSTGHACVSGNGATEISAVFTALNAFCGLPPISDQLKHWQRFGSGNFKATFHQLLDG
jgi:hypothetical protein